MPDSLTLHQHDHAARLKYIYFVCGLAAVLFAYLGKDYFPVHPINLHGILTISALSCFASSVVCGMANILCFINGTRLNVKTAASREGIKNCLDAMIQHKAGKNNTTLDIKTGKEPTIQQIKARFKRLKAEHNKNRKDMTKAFRSSGYWNIFCHFFLLLGFILLICSKFAL